MSVENPFHPGGQTWQEDLISRIELRYHPDDMQQVLQQPVSWDASRECTVSLGQYISARLPVVADSLGLPRTTPETPVKHPTELTPEERKKFAVAFWGFGEKRYGLSLSGHGSFTHGQITDEIKGDTEVGRFVTGTMIGGRAFFLSVVEAGKLSVDPNAQRSTGTIEIPRVSF